MFCFTLSLDCVSHCHWILFPLNFEQISPSWPLQYLQAHLTMKAAIRRVSRFLINFREMVYLTVRAFLSHNSSF